MLKQLESPDARLNIVILDACRNNPFGGRGLRDAGGGLAQMQAPRGTLVSYATQPGNVAMDGAAGHSPYTAALAEVIRKPGIPILEVFNQVGLAVDRATAGRQQPWVAISPLEGTFYFLYPTVVNIPPQALRANPSESFDGRYVGGAPEVAQCTKTSEELLVTQGRVIGGGADGIGSTWRLQGSVAADGSFTGQHGSQPADRQVPGRDFRSVLPEY